MGCAFGLSKSSDSNSTPQTASSSTINNFLNIKKEKIYAPNPNPFKFKVLKEEKLERGMILLVNYDGCTTFKGDKLLLLRCHIDLKYFGKLDPHILGDGHIVCARFEPTPEGWSMARMAANCL